MDPYALAGLLKRIYPKIDMSGFSNRLKIQKTVFLMSKYGLAFGYKFNLYIHGPYSPGLTRDVYIVDNWKSIPNVNFQEEEYENLFNKFFDFMKKNNRKDDLKWLEISATLLLIKNSRLTKDQIVKKCIEIKGIEKKYIQGVYEELKSEGMI